MQQQDLKPNPGSHKARKRVGRGISAGQGKTAGRGTKGQGSRSGPNVRRGFEGGQNPIYMRMPYKRGFTNIFKQPFAVVNVARLEELFAAGDEITPEALVARRAVTDKVLRPPVVPFKGWQVKILGDGEITKALTVRVHRVTTSAREKIVAAGGTVEETAAAPTETAEEETA
ncbi:MAG: 50S ribosomal protein L15 [Thermomicrobiales bacterium]